MLNERYLILSWELNNISTAFDSGLSFRSRQNPFWFLSMFEQFVAGVHIGFSLQLTSDVSAIYRKFPKIIYTDWMIIKVEFIKLQTKSIPSTTKPRFPGQNDLGCKLKIDCFF